jgi:predicted MFS family arabinose efflux permease
LKLGETFDNLSVFAMHSDRLPKEVFSIQILVLLSYSSIAVLTLLPLFFKSLGGSPSQIGFLVGIFSFASFFFRPVGGWLLTRGDPGKILMAGLVIVLTATASHLLIRQLDWFVIFLRIFHGFGFSLVILAALLIVVLIVQQSQRAYALGVVSTGFMLPILVVPALAEEIIKRFGFFYYFLCAIFFAAMPVLYAVFSRIRPIPVAEDEEMRSVGFFRLLKQKKILCIFLLTFVPLLAHQNPPMRAGYFYTCLALTAVFMRLVAGRWLKFWGNPRLLFPAFYFLSGGAALLFLSQSSRMLCFSGFVWGFGVGILYPHLSALSVEGVRARERGKALGLFASSVDLGFALGPITFGWLSQAFGVREAFLPLALILFLTSSVFLFLGQSSLVAVEIEQDRESKPNQP